MKIELEISNENEGTESPYWLIINPAYQVMRLNDDSVIDQIANMITGPFFSRKEAQDHLMARRYAFSKNAKVYCHSGYWSNSYKEAIRNSEKSVTNEPEGDK